ncbi:putative polysaccharide biosynthesis protein [Caldibacillus debilis]|uniref:putative polysaccharide biosynthesis protein n=1 Tax=Caldibacillus debilis TaxID=301148 RepID=UPI000B55EEFA|nr:polysaccharide biosynthesis protein [Caldibacillus debilis]OUM91822.1 MAG: cell division protein [Caldibacillus debilis]
MSKLLRGTFILTLGNYISKILGVLYVIPFAALVGSHGTVLYNYSYVPYSIFISISTAGIPLAVSKFIAKYNTLEEYTVGYRLFKSGLLVMTLSGLAAFLTLYFSAPLLADIIHASDDQITTKGEVVIVIRSVSFALIIVPVMSLLRGFFQGHESMGPTAVSQVVEQIVRVVFLLAGAFIVLHLMDGTVVQAIQVATFAAFVGGVGGFLVLIWYWIKRQPYLQSLFRKDRGTKKISYRTIYKEILSYSIPFVIVGIANPLFQLADIFTFNRAMAAVGLARQSDVQLNYVNFYAHKLVTIPVSLATAFSLTLIPLVTGAFVRGDRRSLNHQLNQTFQVLLFLTLPAIFGLIVLAEPIYTIFYGHDPAGSEILAFYSPVSLLFALFSVTAAILQGIEKQKYAILSLLIGLLIKLLLNVPLIEWLAAKGAILATAAGYSAAVLLNLAVIGFFADYRYHLVFRRGLLMVILNFAMYFCVFLALRLLSFVFDPASRLQAFLLVILCGLFGAAVYFYLSKKSRLLHLLFREQMLKMKKRLSTE